MNDQFYASKTHGDDHIRTKGPNADRIKEQVDIVEVIGKHVDLEQKGNEWWGCCPFHNEQTPSFSVNPGKGVFRCFGCGIGGSVIDFVMKIDGLTLDQACHSLAGQDATPRRATTGQPKKQADSWVAIMPVPSDAPPPFQYKGLPGNTPTGRWAYRDATGATLFYQNRFDRPDGTKEFAPLTFCQNSETGERSWRWKAPNEPRPLYGLDRLNANADGIVIVCEGEKAAGAAQKLFPDHIAITSLNGSQSPEKSDWTPLRGRQVVLWPDNDEAGRKYARTVARLLQEVSK